MEGRMELAAVITSAVALAVSIGHLVWDTVKWRRSGRHVVVDAGAVPVGGSGLSLIYLKANNVGRSPAQVIHAGLVTVDKVIVPFPLPEEEHEDGFTAPTLPHALGAGEQVDWGMRPFSAIQEYLRRQGYDGAVTVYGFVNLGDGRQIRSKPFVVEA